MSYDLREDAADAVDAADDEPQASQASTSSAGWRRGRARSVPPSRRAFLRFYREHFGLVWSMVRRFGVPSAQHEDAVQEVWLVAYRRLHTLEPEASAKAWLSSITRRVASRLRRTDHRQRRKLVALGHAVERPRSPAACTLEQQDARRLLDAVLAELDDEQRDVLMLAQVHGLTGPEIAHALEIPLNTAYSRLRLARRRVLRFASELGAERAAVLGALRRGERPPPQAAARAWVLLVPKLGLSVGAVATATSTSGSIGLFGVKTLVIAVGLGVVGLGVVRGVVDARAAAPRDVVAIEAAAGSGLPDAGPSMARQEPSDSVRERAPAPRVGLASSAGALDDDIEAAAALPSPPRARLPMPPASGRRTSSPASPAAEPPSPPSPDVELATLTAEAELLGRAQRALRSGDPAVALQLLEEHERRFPRGELRDERRGARVRVLCDLGRGAQARAEARRLLHDRPSSPVAAGVADVCS